MTESKLGRGSKIVPEVFEIPSPTASRFQTMAASAPRRLYAGGVSVFLSVGSSKANDMVYLESSNSPPSLCFFHWRRGKSGCIRYFCLLSCGISSISPVRLLHASKLLPGQLLSSLPDLYYAVGYKQRLRSSVPLGTSGLYIRAAAWCRTADSTGRLTNAAS